MLLPCFLFFQILYKFKLLKFVSTLKVTSQEKSLCVLQFVKCNFKLINFEPFSNVLNVFSPLRFFVLFFCWFLFLQQNDTHFDNLIDIQIIPFFKKKKVCNWIFKTLKKFFYHSFIFYSLRYVLWIGGKCLWCSKLV